MKGRVLFIAPSAYPLGGVQVWLDYLLPALPAQGWQPLLGLAAGKVHDVQRYVDQHPGHEVVSIQNPTGSPEGRVQAVAAAIRRTAPALVVAVNIGACYPAMERERIRGGSAPRLAMADHAIEPDFLVEASAWRHVLDGFIGTNRLTVRLAQSEAGLDPQRTHYAQYGVSVAPLRTRDPAKPGDPLRIAYCGRLDQTQKRAQDIPAILRELDRMHVRYEFRLAGAGPALPDLERQLPKGSLLGALAPDEVQSRIYEWADVLLVTSWWETGPIVIWEAMSQGLAVVSTRFIGSGCEQGLVDADNSLLFDIGDVHMAARQLQRATDPQLRADLARRGHELVASRYTREQSVLAWGGCLDAIMAAPPLPRISATRPSRVSGRLDRWFGTQWGERVRRLAGRSYPHDQPGGEWPHSEVGMSAVDESRYWPMAAKLDRP